MHFFTENGLDFLFLLDEKEGEYVLSNFTVYYHNLSQIHICQCQKHQNTIYNDPKVDFGVVVEFFGVEGEDVVDAIPKNNTINKNLHSTKCGLFLSP